MSRPRVLELIFGNTLGGAEVLLREMLRVVDRSRFDWHVGTLRDGKTLDEYQSLQAEMELGVHHVHCGRGLDLRCVRALTRLFREKRFDVVHTHLFRADVHGRMAARRADVPAIITTAHVFRTAHSGWVRDWMDRRTARLADRVAGCTETISREIQASLRLPEGRVVTLRNGITLGRFRGTVDVASLRREFGFADDQPVVGIIGRLTMEKNHEDFLKMAARVGAVRPDCRFLIIGDGHLRRPLELEAARLGVADRVRFTGHRSDIVALLGLLDCLVLCSRWEALPVTLLEAMAAGTPCVSTDVGGCGDLVRSGETGWLVPPADVEALSRAVQACLAGGEEVKSIASRAREFVTRHHSIEQVARDHEALYEAVLREKGGRQRAV